jgi:Ni/Fe-hydrogenase b-type cytochrome subunit
MTATMRILHWLLAASVLACFVTGLYIATPFGWLGVGRGPSDALVMGSIRFVHFAFAMILDVAFLAWFYLFFFSLEVPFVRNLFPVGQRAREAWQMLCHYFTLRNKPSTRTHTDPLNAYGFILMHFLVLAQMLTGFALMRPTFSNANSLLPLWPWMLRVSEAISVWLFRTLVAVRQVHHVVAFLTVALAMCHIYLQVWRELFWHEGHISVVVSGYKYIEEDGSGPGASR